MDCVKLNVFDLPISTQEFIDLNEAKHKVYVSLGKDSLDLLFY